MEQNELDEGWIDPDVRKPIKYELVNVKDLRGRQQYAWWAGDMWQMGIKKIGIVKCWRHVPRGMGFTL